MLPARQRGWTLLELIIVVALVVILFVAAFEHLLPLRGAAERVAVESTLGALRSALGLEASHRAVKGRLADILAMEGDNPMDWLDVTPPGYRASFEPGEAPRPGEWYFDPANRELVYVLRYPEYVFREIDEPALRWRVTRLATPAERGPRVSIDLVPTRAYAWLPRAGASEVLAWIERSR
jgi:prepilin-type N-terminal cleavage/methylation domain-containing protein